MAQVKIFALKSHLDLYRERVSKIIHTALMTELGLPEDKKFQRFIPMEKSEFIFPSDRTEKYTIIEISMFEGRSPDTLKNLLKHIMREMESQLSMDKADTEITIHQSPKHCWGIRGKTGDELALNYKVEV